MLHIDRFLRNTTYATTRTHSKDKYSRIDLELSYPKQPAVNSSLVVYIFHELFLSWDNMEIHIFDLTISMAACKPSCSHASGKTPQQAAGMADKVSTRLL
ncbi:hypothetical protein EUGRSUZ_C01817 [Eucalyptus grandis]|uniref:Uncharacterized protein n=2 Tax=Eucalyptus grandis TaxID=71139 RepID=A0ACC3LDK2_EUCGR|nr:hypothetical protein EUGRSUZ_C01817 [Eucalyptus grandis]